MTHPRSVSGVLDRSGAPIRWLGVSAAFPGQSGKPEHELTVPLVHRGYACQGRSRTGAFPVAGGLHGRTAMLCEALHSRLPAGCDRDRSPTFDIPVTQDAEIRF